MENMMTRLPENPCRPIKAKRKTLKTFIVVSKGENALNLSACSSLSDMSDSITNNDATKGVSLEDKFNDKISVLAEEKKKKDKSKSVTYAQLYFDIETNMLVTLMQSDLVNRSAPQPPENDDDKSIFENNSLDDELKVHDTKEALFTFVQDESRFQDQTLLTECSSVSSDPVREEPEQCSSFHDSKFRFSDEPIVFSHQSTSQLWMEENEHSLYLLQHCADPWDEGARKAVGCTETLKKLLMIRSCISLASIRQIGDFKFKGPGDGGAAFNPSTPTRYAALDDI